VPDQPYARVATETEVAAVAEASADDPWAEVRAAFQREGLPVTLVDGMGGGRRLPRHQAPAPRWCWPSPRWRIYRLSPMSTPLSVLGGDDGLPGGATNHRHEPVPDPVRAIADAAGVNVAHLVSAMRAFQP
jgi:hypothetical protein